MAESSGRRVSDRAVREATGRGWEEWFAILDADGALGRKHGEIVKLLARHPELTDWWRQSVTVEFEKARGMREAHQAPGGFQVGASRTVGVAADVLFRAWADDVQRARWLPEPITIRRSTAPRSLRITWADDTHVSVQLTARGDRRSQVSLEHTRLADADAAARMKAFWTAALGRLRDLLEAEGGA